MTTSHPIRGYLMLIALVFGAIFVTLFSALTGFVLLQNKTQTQIAQNVQAFSLAESGVAYYRWFLSHFPGDTTNGTGSAGPYSFVQHDTEGNTVGSVSFSLSPVNSCGETTSILISATGISTGTPSVSRTITARYMQPTVASYSLITNDNVWIPGSESLSGAVHGNGGVRMDGTSNAAVESSLDAWNCTSSYGCTPAVPAAAGVLGSSAEQSLWKEATPQIDFAGITASFGDLKSVAQSNGIYYPRVSEGTATNTPEYWEGYHLIFNSNGTVTVRQVTATQELSVTPLNPADGTLDHSLIQSESTLATETLSSNCGLIFIEDNVWIEGTVPNTVTIVAGNVISGGTIQPNIYVKNNLRYTGNGKLTAIAANDVLLSADSPATMTLQGIFVATNGAFGRNLYTSGGSCDFSHEARSSLSFSGTIVSNKKTSTKWEGACGGLSGGYPSRSDSYDAHVANTPPPFTPIISPDYQIFDWQQN